ncbi:multidrug effflux MFS transporter [Silvibacterium acidisoli]|uniref:multidrug effflux MFS transporter n=1 Tax=Acidobacteriaceae bacterium ZG23-2 TaxID=2883246 RepID=UPI00406CC88A
MPVSRHNRRLILPLLGALCIISPFAVDMYLAAFSRIAAEFHTTSAEVSLSLSSYFIGFAIGQLIYGPLLDRFGRKRPLYVGMIAFVAGSIGCALVHDLRSLIVLRFFEALGVCVAQVAAVAMVRDFFPVKDSAKILSLLFLMIGSSPLLAPTIGGFLVGGIGWRWIFALLTAMGTIILLATWLLLPEGHTPDYSVSLKPGPMLAGYWSILRSAQFSVYAISGSLSFAALLAFVAGSPLIFMDGFHISARGFGIVFAVLVMGFIGCSQVNVFLLRRFTSQQIFLSALTTQVFAGTIFLLGSTMHLVDLRSTLFLFLVCLSCVGLTYPNAAAIAMAPFTRDAGRASALLGFAQMAIGSATTIGIGVLGVHSVVPFVAASAVSAMVLLLAGRGRIGELVEVEEGETLVAH